MYDPIISPIQLLRCWSTHYAGLCLWSYPIIVSIFRPFSPIRLTNDSLCRNGACGGGSSNVDGINGGSDDDIAYGEIMPLNNYPQQNKRKIQRQHREDEKVSNKSSFHHRRQSIASSGLKIINL